MNVIIAGGRNFIPTEKHREWLRKELIGLRPSAIFSGGCAGADKFGEKIGHELRYPVVRFTADWLKDGKAAGPIRNEKMAKYANACILFPGGRGTADMKRRAIEHKLIIKEYAECEDI